MNSMRGCLHLLATLAAVLLVITTVFALFTVNLTQVVTSRDTLKQALDAETLVLDVTPALLTEVALEQARAQGSPPADPDPAALQAAIRELLPAGWLETHEDRIVDATFDFLETGDPSAAALQVDAGPILDRLRTETGRRVVLAVVQLLPRCGGPETTTPPEADLSEISYCLPPNLPITDVAAYTHDGLIEVLDETPQLQPADGTLRVSLLAEGVATPAVRERAQWLQQLFALGRRWAWALWLMPLACLALLLLTLRPRTDFAYWLGWSLLVAAGVALLLALLVPPVLSATALQFVNAASDLPRVLLGRLAHNRIDAFSDLWMGRVYVQAGLMLAGAVVLLAIHYVKRRETD